MNKKLKNGYTLLIRASLKGDKELCKHILKNSKMMVDVDAENKDGNTALHMVSFSGYREICKLLLNKKVEMNKKNKNGHTGL